MLTRARTFLVTHVSSGRVSFAAVAALTLMLTPPVEAQGPEVARRHRDREPVVFRQGASNTVREDGFHRFTRSARIILVQQGGEHARQGTARARRTRR